MEKAQLPSPAEHPSYRKHRREVQTKIIAPMLIAVLLMIAVCALIGVATFRDNGDVERWAAISTIWIVIPWMFVGLIALVLLAAMVYGMARLLQVIPPYTGYAQKMIWRVQGYIKRGADMIVQPVLSLDGITATLKRLFGAK